MPAQPSTSPSRHAVALAGAVVVARLAAAGALLANASLFAIMTSQSILYPYNLDYGEGPLLDQAHRLARGISIYTSLQTPPWVVANYPPLYPLLLAPFTLLFPPTFLFGRGLATVAAVASGILAGGIVYRLTGSRFAVLVTALTFLGLYPVREWSRFARTDTLGLALVVGGLFALTYYSPGGPPRGRLSGASRRALVVAGVLLVAGAYTKQSLLLAAPGAACLYLLARSWRHAVLFGAALVGVVVGLALAIQVATGGNFLLDVITANTNTLSADLARGFDTRLLAEEGNLFLAGAVVLGYLAWKRKGILVATFAVLALSNLVTVAKVGSSVNYFLELEAGLAMLLGLGFGYLAAHRASAARIAQVALLVAIAWQASAMYQKDLPRAAGLSEELAGKRAADEVVLDWIRRADGPVIGDDVMGALYLLGRPIEIQPFEYSRLAIEGKWDQRPFLEAIEARRYALVVFTTGMKRARYTPEMLAAIQASYRLAAVAGGSEIWVPRT